MILGYKETDIGFGHTNVHGQGPFIDETTSDAELVFVGVVIVVKPEGGVVIERLREESTEEVIIGGGRMVDDDSDVL